MSVEHVINQELYSRVKGSINFLHIDYKELLNINRNLYPTLISSVCLASAKLEDSPIDNLYMMIPSTRHLLKVSVSYQIGYHYPKKIYRVFSLIVEKDFPLVVYVGAIVEGKLPYTIVATDVKKGFLKKERMFLPLTGEELSSKSAEQIYKHRNEFIELINRLNSDEEVRLLLKKLQSTCRYNADAFGHPAGTSLNYSCDVKFEKEKEGFVHLIPLGDKIAITLVSTPKPISFPSEVFGELDKELAKIQHSADERLIGRKILLDYFIPYEFSLQEKLRLIERIATVVATYKYEGVVKSNYVPKTGVSDFVECITEQAMGEKVEVDVSVKPLSREEFIESAVDYALNLLQVLHILADEMEGVSQRIIDLQHKLQDKNWHVRMRAARALGKTWNPKAVEPLIQALKNDEEWAVRVEAAKAFGKIKDPRAVEPLIQALKNDESADVRSAVAYVLGDIGDARALDALTQAVEDKDWFVRRAAKIAIEQIQKKLHT